MHGHQGHVSFILFAEVLMLAHVYSRVVLAAAVLGLGAVAAPLDHGTSQHLDTPTNTAMAGLVVDPKNIDRTVDLGDDFYKFADGAWLARTESRHGSSCIRGNRR